MNDPRGNPADHPPPELLFGYEHGLLLPDELKGVDGHIADCSACRERLAGRLNVDGMVADVRSELGLDRQRSPFRALAYLAAAAALAVAAGSIWQAQRRGPQATPSRRAEIDSPAVRDALRSGRLPVPSYLEQLNSPREVLMGGSQEAPTRPLSPAGTAVLGPGVRFRWTPLPGPWRYQVKVFILGGESVLSSPETTDSAWSCSDLSPSENYEWQVLAVRGSERVTLPEPPQTPPRFRVLEPATSERLRDLARREPESHLLLGVEFARVGALDNARTELAEALRQNPERGDVRKLLESLPPERNL